MSVSRKVMIEALDCVSAALMEGKKNLIPVLSHFWFTRDRVMAFNGQLAIEAPLQSGIEGALPGSLLLSLLKASRAANLDVTVEGFETRIKAARALFKLPMIGIDVFSSIFKWPTVKGEAVDVEPLLDGMKHCLRSVSTDTSIIEQLGITCSFDAEGVSMFSTNGNTLSHARVTLPKRPFGLMNDNTLRVVLPALFCRELVSLAKNKKGSIKIDKTCALVELGDTWVYTQLIALQAKPLEYEEIIEQNLPKATKLDDVPKNMHLAITRACVVADSNLEEQQTAIVIKDGVMTLTTKNALAEAIDVVQCGEHQADASLAASPRFMSGCEAFDKMTITPTCIAFTSADKRRVYMIAARQE